MYVAIRIARYRQISRRERVGKHRGPRSHNLWLAILYVCFDAQVYQDKNMKRGGLYVFLRGVSSHTVSFSNRER